MTKMRYTFCLLLTLLMGLMTATARNISEAEAAQRAALYLQRCQHGMPASSASLTLVHTLHTVEAAPAVYVFTRSSGGYVIASADDRAYPVLAYSDSGTFSEADMPENMRAWLQHYADEIASLDAEQTPTTAQGVKPMARTIFPTAEIKDEVAPLLGATKWDQGMPYFQYCPTTTGTNGQTTHCFTGCAATAIGQIMYHHRHPAQGTGSHQYRSNTYGFSLSSDFSQHTYDWDNMLPTYTSSYTDAQGEAVALLLSDVGIAAEMDYSPKGSGTYNALIAQALVNNFSYDKGLRLLERCIYTQAEWNDIVKAELSQGRPVYMTGANGEAGHAFVCDGYNDSDFFHINWGWSGKSNDYFRLSALDPAEQGAGGSSAGYNNQQNILIGVKPSAGSDVALPTLRLSERGMWSEISGGTYYLWASIGNYDYVDYNGRLCLRIYDGETLLNAADEATEEVVDIAQQYGTNGYWDIAPEYLREGLRYTIEYDHFGTGDWTPLRAPYGVAAAMVCEKTASGDYRLVPDASEIGQILVADMQPTGPLYVKTDGRFNITFHNPTSAECYTDVRITMTGSGTEVQTPMKMVCVPAHSTVTEEVRMALPNKAGIYDFALSYMDINNMLQPLASVDGEKQAIYQFEVTEQKYVGLVEFNLLDLTHNANETLTPDATLTFDATIVNSGGYGEGFLRADVEAPGTSFGFATERKLLDNEETYAWHGELPLTGFEPGKYTMKLVTYLLSDPTPFVLATVPFTVTAADGISAVSAADEATPRYRLDGRRATTSPEKSIIITREHKVLAQ